MENTDQSAMDLFVTGEAVRFSIRESRGVKAVVMSIKRCPVTGEKVKRHCSEKGISGLSLKETFEILWEEMIRVLSIEKTEALDRLKIIVRHNLVGWEKRHADAKKST